jgi:hypothetical protein
MVEPRIRFVAGFKLFPSSVAWPRPCLYGQQGPSVEPAAVYYRQNARAVPASRSSIAPEINKLRLSVEPRIGPGATAVGLERWRHRNAHSANATPAPIGYALAQSFHPAPGAARAALQNGI